MESTRPAATSPFGRPFNVVDHVDPLDLSHQNDMGKRFDKAYERFDTEHAARNLSEGVLITYTHLHQDVAAKLKDKTLRSPSVAYYRQCLAEAKFYIGFIRYQRCTDNRILARKNGYESLVKAYDLMKKGVSMGYDGKNTLGEIKAHYTIPYLCKCLTFDKAIFTYAINFLKFRRHLQRGRA